MATTLPDSSTTAAPLQEPRWKWVQIPAYELDKDVLERHLQEDFGPWKYHVKFLNDWYTLRVPEDTTEKQLKALKERPKPPRRSTLR